MEATLALMEVMVNSIPWIGFKGKSNAQTFDNGTGWNWPEWMRIFVYGVTDTVRKLNIKFDMQKPEHGWMRCVLSFQDETIEFDASDVPCNPLDGLVESLWKCSRGENSEVWWHLEPAGYYFLFVPQESCVDFAVAYSEDSSKKRRRIIQQATLPLDQLLIMFWRSVKKVESFGLGEPHWPTLDLADLDGLRARLGDI